MDKIKLKTHDFDLKKLLCNDNFELETKYIPSPYNSRSELVENHLDKIKTAYINRDDFNIDLRRYKNNSDWFFAIHFNPNKIYQQNNSIMQPIDNLSNENLFEVFSGIQTQLYELGIDIDLKETSLARYDVCLDIETALDPKAYYPMNSKLKPSGKYKQQKSNYEGTLYFRSKTSEICIYNKTKEQENKEGQTDGNVLRYEFRYKKKLKDIKLKEIDFTNLKDQSRKRLLNLFEVELMQNDIQDQILIKLNDNLETFNNSVKELKEQALILLIKQLLNETETEHIRDLIYKDLNKTEKETASRLNTKVKKIMLTDPYLNNLYTEVKSKLETKSKIYGFNIETCKTYNEYLQNNGL